MLPRELLIFSLPFFCPRLVPILQSCPYTSPSEAFVPSLIHLFTSLMTLLWIESQTKYSVTQYTSCFQGKEIRLPLPKALRVPAFVPVPVCLFSFFLAGTVTLWAAAELQFPEVLLSPQQHCLASPYKALVQPPHIQEVRLGLCERELLGDKRKVLQSRLYTLLPQ